LLGDTLTVSSDRRHRRQLLAGSLALAAAGSAGAAPAAAGYQAVFQVSDADPAKWSLTLNNARNAQAELGAGNVVIEIVAFGPGVAMLKAGSDVAARLAEAGQAGIRALACENSMRGFKLTHDQMAPTVGYVPSGVAHLIRRQTEGYAYIRS
jgi:intracellular sulfur oxidation DsrE/DsrF family protein